MQDRAGSEMWDVLLVPSSSPTLSPVYDGLDVSVTYNVTWFHLNHDMVSRRIYKLSFYGGHSITSGVNRPKYKKKAPFSLVSLSVYPRSRRGAERIRQGEGRWSRPPKTALERSYLTGNSSSENRILRPRRKKTPDRIPPSKE